MDLNSLTRARLNKLRVTLSFVRISGCLALSASSFVNLINSQRAMSSSSCPLSVVYVTCL